MNKAISRAFEIIKFIGNAQTPPTLSDISSELCIPKSTVFDIIDTLEEEHIIEITNSPIKSYKLTSLLYRLGVTFLQSEDLLSLTSSILETISSECNATAFFTIRDQDRIVYMQKKEPASLVIPNIQIGDTAALHTTAEGKVFLADMSVAEIQALLGQEPLHPSTPFSKTIYASLLDEIKEVRMYGYATDIQESNENSLCAAAPILDIRNQVIGAISVIGFHNRNLEDLLKWEKILVENALIFSKERGYLGNSLYM